MFDTFKNRLEITGTLTTVTALRISAGRSTEPIGSDLPVIKDALGRPLIPGSSFKGALRSRLESFLRGIVGSDRKKVANPAVNDEWSLTATELSEFKEKILKNVKQEEKEDRLNDFILSNTDLISHLFGSPWIASKFQVRDLTVQADAWFGQYQERDGVAIDRDTETAADGKLYDYQVVPAGTPFDFKAVVENARDWELGLLMIGLHQFETEQIPLGGGRSRGLGVVKLEIDKMRWVDVEDHPEFLLEYLKKLVMGDETAYEDAADYKDEWVQKLIDRLTRKETKLSETQTQAQ
jgi:CRISPR-associated RAMP protein (TIGR02581 family)